MEPAEPAAPPPPGVAVRAYTRPCRRRRVDFRHSDDEYAAVAAAAARAGYTTSGFIAETALAAAGERDELPPTLGLQRELVVALNLAREQVARIGTNLNQAVARLNATGEPPPWLDRAVALSARVVARLEDTAAEISAGLPGGHRGAAGGDARRDRQGRGAPQGRRHQAARVPVPGRAGGGEEPVLGACEPADGRLLGRRPWRARAAPRGRRVAGLHPPDATAAGPGPGGRYPRSLQARLPPGARRGQGPDHRPARRPLPDRRAVARHRRGVHAPPRPRSPRRCRRGALGRDPARRRPRARGGHTRPGRRETPQHPQRSGAVPKGVQLHRGQVRAGPHLTRAGHRREAPHPERDPEGPAPTWPLGGPRRRSGSPAGAGPAGAAPPRAQRRSGRA